MLIFLMSRTSLDIIWAWTDLSAPEDDNLETAHWIHWNRIIALSNVCDNILKP